MKTLGILSDVHGNLPATEAILRDMSARGVTDVLFVGDVQGEWSEPLETLRRIRAVPGLYAVRGNRERYMQALEGQDLAARTDEQFATLYWNMRRLPEAERLWLQALPDVMTMAWEGLPPVTMAHEAHRLFGETAADAFWGDLDGDWPKEKRFDRPTLLAYVQRKLQDDARMRAAMNRLPPGVYICAHAHVQWHAVFEGRLLLNPGGAGLPLDRRTGGAPYTLLTGEAGAWRIEERYVPYDVETTIERLRNSDLYACSDIYNRINIAQLRTGVLIWDEFLDFVAMLAGRRGSLDAPIDNETWRRGKALWLARREEAELRPKQ